MKYIKQFESYNDKVITTSYQTYTSEDDDYDQGWEDENGESMIPDEYDIEEGITAVDKAVEFLKNKKYTTEPSSTDFNPGIWYTTTSPDINYRTGEETYYSCHLNGFTESEEFEIFKIITWINFWEGQKVRKDAKKYNL